MTRYCLFNTENNKDPLEVWNSQNPNEYFVRIGDSSEVIDRLKKLFPRLVKWEIHKHDNDGTITHTCLGENNCSEDVYLDISVHENCRDEGVYLIFADRATDGLLKTIMKEFNIKYVFFPEGWELIDVD